MFYHTNKIYPITTILFFQFFYWMAGASGDVYPFFAGGHALGAAFNQLVRSRAQLLLLE